jgi:hypothetical protein
MRKLTTAAAVAVVAALGGLGIAYAASNATIGTNVSCATATATLPNHTVGVDGVPVDTISGTTTTVSQCNTQTYTVPTTTVTSTVTGSQTTTPSSSSSSSQTTSVSASSSSTTTTTPSSTTSTTSLGGPPPALSAVGSGGAPSPSCSTTVAVNGGVSTALANATAGQTVCLADGTWSEITISRTISQSPGVTLAAKDPGQAVVNGITLDVPVSNLTVEGLDMNEGFQVHNAATNDTFEYNTMEGWGGGDAQSDSAFFLFPGEDGASGGSVTGISMLYNQIDNVPQCFEDDTDGGNTFSHNVCGPGIGYDGSTGQHYIQAENVSNDTFDNNAFEGPLAPGAVNNGSHTNVLHACGASLQFNNNIVWETQAVAQTLLWGDDCQTTNSQANNNLFVESSSPDTYSMWIDSAHNSSNVTFSNDTVVNQTNYGAFYNEISSFHAHNDLADSPNAYDGFTNCDCSNNAANDGTGTVGWNPAWLTISWTPTAGAPWTPPPPGYYKPSGIASTFGYQGTIGP